MFDISANQRIILTNISISRRKTAYFATTRWWRRKAESGPKSCSSSCQWRNHRIRWSCCCSWAPDHSGKSATRIYRVFIALGAKSR